MNVGRLLKRLSISGITLRNTPFPEQARIVAEAGCGGFGIFAPLLAEYTPVEVVETLDRFGLRTTVCVPQPFTLGARRSWGLDGRLSVRGDSVAASVEAIIASVRWLAPLRPESVVVIPGAQLDRSRAQAWDEAVAGVGEIARAASDLGIRVALEPVHPRFATDFSLLGSLGDAARLIDDVGHPNVGVLIEPFHVWNAADLAEQIAGLTGRITAVQISDSPLHPRSIADRLPPGEGAADLPRILAAIEAAGYTGSYDCEIVSDDGSLGTGAYADSVWKRPPKASCDPAWKGRCRPWPAPGPASRAASGRSPRAARGSCAANWDRAVRPRSRRSAYRSARSTATSRRRRGCRPVVRPCALP